MNKGCRYYNALDQDYCVVLHFNEIIDHNLNMHHGRFSNEMIHHAYEEWKIAQEKKAAKKAMMGNMKNAFQNLINKQKELMAQKAAQEE